MHLCDQCNKTYKNKSSLIRHLEVHNNIPLQCECGDEFNSSRKLKEHKKKHMNNKPYKCKDCQKSFSCTSGLWCHKRLVHKNTIKCTVCDKIFGQKGHLAEHMTTHSDDKRFNCQTCHKKFKYKRNAGRHSKQCAQARVVVPDAHKCPVCPNTKFKTKKYLEEHRKAKHSPDTQFQCPTCGSLFKWRTSLSRHIGKGRCPKTGNTD